MSKHHRSTSIAMEIVAFAQRTSAYVTSLVDEYYSGLSQSTLEEGLIIVHPDHNCRGTVQTQRSCWKCAENRCHCLPFSQNTLELPRSYQLLSHYYVQKKSLKLSTSPMSCGRFQLGHTDYGNHGISWFKLYGTKILHNS